MENPAPEDASWRASKVPSGSALDRGMCVEKRTNDRPEEGGTLNSGDPEPTPPEPIYLQGDSRDRQNGDAGTRRRESEPTEVVDVGPKARRERCILTLREILKP